MPHSQQITLKGAWPQSLLDEPLYLPVMRRRETGNLKWDPGEMWTNDHEIVRSQLSRDVPSASGEATRSGLSGPLALSSPLIQFNVQISLTVCPLGTYLGKAQTLSPVYI